MQAEPLNVLIGTIPKGSRDELRVSLSEYRGAQFVDLRVYSEFAASTDARSPTKAGATVTFDRLPALIETLQAAEAEARARGLLGDAA